TFGRDLSQKSDAPHPDRAAHRVLLLALQSTHQQQRCRVSATDQQNQCRRSQQRKQNPPAILIHFLGHGCELRRKPCKVLLRLCLSRMNADCQNSYPKRTTFTGPCPKSDSSKPRPTTAFSPMTGK